MQHVMIVIHLMLVSALIGLVLLQRSEGGGLGIGGGGGFMTNRGAGNVMTRATAIVGGLFFVTSLILSILASTDRKPASILGGSGPAQQVPAGTVPPLGGGSGGILDTLRQSTNPPAAPSGPQAPQSQ